MNTESQKVQETKSKIKKAFIQLCLGTALNKITVKDITDAAAVNRGTFYVYYTGIPHLKECIQKELVEAVQATAGPMIIKSMQGQDFTAELYDLADVFAKKSTIIKAFLVNNRDPETVGEIKNLFHYYIKDYIQEKLVGRTILTDYALEYVISGQIAVITKWIDNDMDLSIENFVQLIRHLTLEGAIPYLFHN